MILKKTVMLMRTSNKPSCVTLWATKCTLEFKLYYLKKPTGSTNRFSGCPTSSMVMTIKIIWPILGSIEKRSV